MSKNNLSLSIVIPAYNEENHLKACLESITTQIEKPDEVIVVDNNSTDQTRAIARQYTFVQLLSEPKQGIAHAHHAGFKAAHSQFIARIDADSVLPADWVKRIRDFYSDPRRHKTVITGTGYFRNVKFLWLHTKFIDGAFIATRVLLGQTATWGPNMVIPRTVWQNIENETCEEKPTTYDDLDIALHINNHKVPIVWLRSLRVGVRLKHLESPIKFWHYTRRWPLTLRNHRDWRWLIAWPGCLFMTIVEYPVLWLLKKTNHT